MVSESLFGSHLVAIGNGHVVHLVAEADDEHILRVGPSGTNAFPNGDMVLGSGIFPVSYNEFAADAHARNDVAEFAVAMSALVEVHEVHVDVVPWNFGIILGVEVQKGLV